MLVGAKSQSEAIDRHRQYIQRSLGLISKSIWIPGRTAAKDAWFLVTAPDRFVTLTAGTGASLYLTASQSLTVDRHRAAVIKGSLFTGYKVRLTGYVYSIGPVPDPDASFVEWHWHPRDGGETHAHVHVRDELLGTVGKLHLPTSRVFFEQVVAFPVGDLKVDAPDDWRTVLDGIQWRVEEAARWRGAHP